jgi:hypothetical protein
MNLRRSTGASTTDSTAEQRGEHTVDYAKERRDTGAVREHGTPGGTGTLGAHSGHHAARERFGGVNWGSGFYGWLVAIGITILLTSIVGAVVAAVGSNADISQTDAERQAGTIGITAAAVMLAVLAIAYFIGGYVAGRMSRFDGGKQGLAVWVIGLLVTLLAIAAGAIFGNEYNILDRVDLPRLPLSTDQLSTGGIITAVAVVVLTLLAAMAGGKVGHRYHDKVDRVAHH